MPITRVKVAGIDCDDLLRPTSTSVVVTGTDFGFIQAWPLRLCDGPSLGAAKVDQVVTAWSDTSITFDVVLGALAESDTLYLRIDDGGSTPVQRRVTVSQPDVSVHAGSFTASLTTGSQVMVTGLPSKPKAVIWWTSGASGLSQVSGQGVGFSFNFLYLNHSGLSVSHSAGASRNDAASYSTKGRRTTGVSLTSLLTNNTTRTSTFAFTADGLSINWLQTDTVARVVHYIAFCGRTVSASGVASTAVSAGSFASLPHKPDVVFVAHNANTGGNATDGPMLGFGAIARDIGGTIKQWSCAWSAFSPDAASSLVHSKLCTDRFAEQVYNGAATWSAQATALAYQTCTWSGTDTDVLQHVSLYLDGMTVDIGTVTKATSATSTSVGAISDPDAMLLVTGGGTKDVVEGYANMAVGVASASHQSHARTWADLIGSLTEGTQASDTAKAIGSFSAAGVARDVGTLSLAGTPTITWDTPRAGTSEVAYLAFKAASSATSATPTSVPSSSAAHAATATISGIVDASPADVATSSAAQVASSTAAGSIDAAPASVAATSSAAAVNANPAGAITATPASIASSSQAHGATATPSGAAAATPSSVPSSSAAHGATAAVAGSVSASPSGALSSAAAHAASAQPSGASPATPASVAATSAAQAAEAQASGTIAASPASVSSSATAHPVTASSGGIAQPSSVPSSAAAHAATANATGSVPATPWDVAPTSHAHAVSATPSGTAGATPATASSASSGHPASATVSGVVSATPMGVPSTAAAYPASVSGATDVTPTSVPSSSAAHPTTAVVPQANPYPAAPGVAARCKLVAQSSRCALTSRSPRMSALPNYQLRLGDTAPALECMLTELPGDLDNSNVRLLFKLPGASSEHVRNATSFDVATGTACYQWEASDFPVGTKTGRVAVRWEFLTTEGKRGTTNVETFTIVA